MKMVSVVMMKVAIKKQSSQIVMKAVMKVVMKVLLNPEGGDNGQTDGLTDIGDCRVTIATKKDKTINLFRFLKV